MVPVPNPNPPYLSVHSEGDADAVQMRVFSKALTLVWKGEQAQNIRTGWNQVPLDRGLIDSLPNGLYFVELKPLRGAQVGLGGPIVKLALLR